MIDWRKLYMTYQTLNLSQAVDIFVNSSEEELKTLPRSEQIRIYKDRETARATILQSLYANSFVHGRAGNKYIDTDERFIIIERKSYLDWCSEIGVNLEGYIKQTEIKQNTAYDKSSQSSLPIEDDMPETMKIVWTLWHELRQNEGRLTLQSVTQEIDSRYANLNLNDELKKSCARVLIGMSQGGRPPKTSRKDS